MGDTIDVSGWELEPFRKNPVVLWAHDASMPPIAKAPRVWPEGGKLKADAEFVPADNPACGRFAEGIYQLYKGGFMSATSVGFNATKWVFADRPGGGWGIDFLGQELLEFSCVPIPANAEALIEGKSAGIDILPVLDFCEAALLRSADGGRVVKLADAILGGNGKDAQLLEFAQKIAKSAGMGLLSLQRIEAVERAATKQRLADQKAARGRTLDLIKAKEPR
jgi:hypothetical protein